MSKFDGRNGLAVGLVAGISITINFFIWSVAGFEWMWSNDAKPYSYTYTEQKCAEQKISDGMSIPLVLNSENAQPSKPRTENPDADKKRNPYQPNWCDLASQESMAKSTYWMNRAAWAAIALSLLGVWLIWRTLAATKYTLKATQEMASDQSRIGEAQTRAYVHAEKVDFFWGDSEASSPRVSVSIINTGVSPAKWFEIAGCAYLEKLTSDGRVENAEPFDRSKFSHKTYSRFPNLVSNGGILTCPIFDEHDSEIAKRCYNSLENALTIIGVIRYATIFDEVFESEFAFYGRGIPEFRSDITRAEETTKKQGTINFNEKNTFRNEIPHQLQRITMRLNAYKKVED